MLSFFSPLVRHGASLSLLPYIACQLLSLYHSPSPTQRGEFPRTPGNVRLMGVPDAILGYSASVFFRILWCKQPCEYDPGKVYCVVNFHCNIELFSTAVVVFGVV